MGLLTLLETVVTPIQLVGVDTTTTAISPPLPCAAYVGVATQFRPHAQPQAIVHQVGMNALLMRVRWHVTVRVTALLAVMHAMRTSVRNAHPSQRAKAAQ